MARSLARFVTKRLRFTGFMGVSRRSTLRTAVIKTHEKITGDQIKRTSRVAFASALLPTAATSQLHCVELFELDEHLKTDPTVDDFYGANEGVTMA